MPLESGSGATDYHSMDLSRAAAFWIGLVGFASGVLGVIIENRLLAGFAGLCALVVGVASLKTARHRVLSLSGVSASGSEGEAAIIAPGGAGSGPASIAEPMDLTGGNGADSAVAPTTADHVASEPTLDVRDPLTDFASGLYNEPFFRATLGSKVSAARRHLRPVGVALIDVLLGLPDGPSYPPDPATVADGIRSTLRDADTSCRLEDGRFALILEDTPENGAVWTVERLRRRLAADDPELTLWAGVACYPAHAFDATELLERAEQALTAAREWRQDRIEIATSE